MSAEQDPERFNRAFIEDLGDAAQNITDLIERFQDLRGQCRQGQAWELAELRDDLGWHATRIDLVTLAASGLAADVVPDPTEALLLGLRELRDEVEAICAKMDRLQTQGQEAGE